MPTVTIATLIDVPLLASLVNGAYRGETAKTGWTTESDLLDGTRIDEETLAAYITDPKCAVLKYTDDDGLPQACMLLTTHADNLYLGMLTVNPLLQNKGIGKVLLGEAEKYAKQVEREVISITVIDCRHELIAWYERHGYNNTGETEPFPADPEFGLPKIPIHFIVMEKKVG